MIQMENVNSTAIGQDNEHDVHLGDSDAPALELDSRALHLRLQLLAVLAPRSVEPDLGETIMTDKK